LALERNVALGRNESELQIFGDSKFAIDWMEAIQLDKLDQTGLGQQMKTISTILC
jgi:hypothetical protein